MSPEIIDAIAGAVLPPFIDLVNQHVENSKARYAISLIVSLLIAVLLNIQELSLKEILASGGIIFASAQTVYKTYYEKSALRSQLTK